MDQPLQKQLQGHHLIQWAGITATDPEDGTLTGSITHTGSVDVNVAGVYTLDYRVEDSDGNVATATPSRASQ